MASYEEYIRNKAASLGIDPNVALKVAKGEGGVNGFVQSNVMKPGVGREPSYGPFQLLVGGEGTGFPEGMGNQMMRETGLDPRNPANAQAGIDFALGQAKNKGWGQWYGAKAAGITGMDGINGAAPRGMTMGSAPSAVASSAPVAGPLAGAGTQLPPLTDRGNITEYPVAEAGADVAGIAPAPAPVDPNSFAGLMGNEKFTGALGKVAGALGGGSASKQDQESANIAPSGIGQAMAATDAARMQSAQTLMAQLLASKRKPSVPGLSMMG